MNSSIRKQITRLSFVGALVVGAASLTDVLFAQEATDGGSQKESVKIEPYTGPPIFLDEPEQVSAPTLVRRDAVREPEEGQVRIERQVAIYSDNHLEADGFYREYYPNGKLFSEGQFVKGRQSGEWSFYYDNGQLNRKAIYKDGQPDGPREVFRADGTLASKRKYDAGLRDGDWIVYDKTGKQPLSEEHYDKGKQVGVWKVWYPNGQLKQEIGIKQGKRDGASIEYDDKGGKRLEAHYVDGKLHGTVTRWYANGRKITQEYEQGKLKSQKNG